MKNKVLVAMGIGIFAALTFNAASVTTLAEESNTDPQNSDENKKYDFNNEMDEAAEAAGEASESVGAAVETITGKEADNEEESIHGTLDTEKALEETAEQVLGLDPNVDKAEDPTTKAEHVYEGTSLEADEEGCFEKGEAGQLKDELLENDNTADAKALIDKIGTSNEEGLLGQMNSQEILAAGYEGNTITEAEKVNATADKADKLVKEANELVGVEPDPDDVTLFDTLSKAGDTVDEAGKAIAGANNQQEADEALDNAQQAVDDADNKVNAAANRVSEIEAELKTLEDEYNTNLSLYNEKVGLLNDAKTKFYQVKAEAESDSAELLAEIKRLEKETDELLAAAEVSKEKYNEEGYALIKACEEYLISKKGQKDLPEYREFVYLYMKYYYIPDVVGGVMEGDYDTFNANWEVNSGTYTYHDEFGNEFTSTKGDVFNKGTVNYTVKDENGVEKKETMYVNYKIADKNNLKDSGFTGLVIFEKVVHPQYKGKDLPSVIQKVVDEEGIYVDGNTTFGKDANGQYYVNENGKTTILNSRYRNDKWYSGDVLLYEFDKTDDETNHYTTDGREGEATATVFIDKDLNNDFRNKIDGVGRIPEALDNLINKAKASKDALVKAEAKVSTLQNEIKDLECKHDAAKVKALNTDLSKAKENLKKVQDERDELLKKFDDLKEQYQQKIDELNYTPEAMVVGTTDIVVDSPLMIADAATFDDVAADDLTEVPFVATAPAGAVLGANRPVEATALGSVRSGSVLGERRGPQGAVLGKRRSPKTADGAMGGMVAGMMLSMMSAFGGAKVLKKKHED